VDTGLNAGSPRLRHDEGWLEGPEGQRLFRQGWAAEGAARGTVLIVHGMAEHSGRYVETASFLAARGWVVEALDYRGHGRSPGLRVHVDDVDDYVSDVRTALEAASRRLPDRPRVLLGHSQGGLIALRFALTSPGEISGVVVTSPFLATHPDSRPHFVRRNLARVLLRIAPRLPLPSGVDARFVSSDPSVVERYRADQLVSARASAGWLRAVTRAQRAVRADAPRLEVPSLIMSSGADRLADPEAARDFAARARAGLVEYVRWEGFFHEMLNEPGRAAVYQRIAAWLDDHFTPFP